MTCLRHARSAPHLIAILTLAGCALGGGGSGEAGPLGGGDLAAATAGLRGRAGRCESGDRGREAILVWAAIELDPRNSRGSAQTAAHLTAHYLQLPEAEPAGISLAEALYLLALDRGARPVDDSPTFPGLARRFTSCGDTRVQPALLRKLPAHPGMPAWRALNSTREQADSLRAELERIRRLLGQGGDPPEARP